MHAKFELYQNEHNHFYFRLRNPSGDNIGSSEGYYQRSGALNGIQSTRINARYLLNFKVFRGQDGYYYYHLTANNNEIILRSSRYITEQLANIDVREVMRYAPTAMIVDLCKSSAA